MRRSFINAIKHPRLKFFCLCKSQPNNSKPRITISIILSPNFDFVVLLVIFKDEYNCRKLKKASNFLARKSVSSSGEKSERNAVKYHSTRRVLYIKCLGSLFDKFTNSEEFSNAFLETHVPSHKIHLRPN